MIMLVKLVFVLMLVAVVTSRTTPSVPAPGAIQGDELTSQESSADTYQLYRPRLPITLELPRTDQYAVPFAAIVQEPSTILRAPQPQQAAVPTNYYQSPVPAQDLMAPVDVAWNPNNDPKLYYEVPAVLTKQELPTKEFPKKYNEEIHLKKKPYSTRPKQELILEPINEEQYELKQKDLQKTFHKLAKKENQKQVQAQPAVQI